MTNGGKRLAPRHRQSFGNRAGSALSERRVAGTGNDRDRIRALHERARELKARADRGDQAAATALEETALELGVAFYRYVGDLATAVVAEAAVKH